MQEYFESPWIISPGMADASGRIAYAEILRLFMDLASVHAELLGVGLKDMASKGYFWLTVKTKLHLRQRPRIGTRVLVSTWPEAPESMRCCRSYAISGMDGQPMAEGKTEWAVLDQRDGTLVPVDQVFPTGLRYDRPSACPGSFADIPEKEGDWTALDEYRVRSTDIDLGGHMNNVAFFRAMIGAIPNARWKSLRPREMDVVFRASAYEGDLLRIEERTRGEALELRVCRGEKTLLLARIV